MTGDHPPPRPPANVFTVPAGVPFLPTLARAILAGGFPAAHLPPPDPLALARWTVLLPTRRAARSLVQAFLDFGGGGARLLPRIRALGDVDEDEFLFTAEGPAVADVPPAIPPFKRLFLLAALIADWARRYPRERLARSLAQSPAQALALAQSLARLIDSFDTEGVPLDAVAGLVEGELAVHQELVLGFLDIVRVKLPAEMARLGFASPAERRNRLMDHEARRLAAGGSAGPVVAAGSTGSVPATARLLAVIARLPEGAVVLPGLDQQLDDESWTSLGPHHPQFGMSELLKRVEVERQAVRPLPGVEPSPDREARAWLASEIMRPAETTERWTQAMVGSRERMAAATAGITAIAAPGQREEALAIALLMRRVLEEPNRTAALVTPDRRLARRVKAELGRWNLDIDDSAGEPLLRTPAGAFAALVAEAAASRFAARELMALLRHPLTRLGPDWPRLTTAIADLEVAVLRGRLVDPGLKGLAAAVERAAVAHRSPHDHPLLARIDAAGWQAVRELVDRLVNAFARLDDLFSTADEVGLADLVRAHVAAAEAAAGDGEASPLWTGEAGEALSSLLAELLDDAPAFPPLKASDYPPLFASLLAAVPVRPRHGRHPRLAILGLLEARLVHADLTILGGLNEGVWPAEAEADPWLNRPQRRSLGLPLPERQIGLSAHDFAQGLAAGAVCLTWSKKIAGQPAVPSRWVLRLIALLEAAGLASALSPGEPWMGWALGLDKPAGLKPIARPAPRPPVAARPWRLSVTALDELIRDPYATFARRVLGLIPLDPLGLVLGAAERGSLVHEILRRFTTNCPGRLPADAVRLLLDQARAVFDAEGIDGATAALWWPQLERMAGWFVEAERVLRQTVERQHVEVTGRLEFAVRGHSFTLTGRADRIDALRDGSLRIVDYKTGTLPSFNETAKKYSPQLLLEAHLATQGAFADIPPAPVSELLYVRLSGGEPAGEVAAFEKDIAAAAASAAAGLRSLLDSYADEATPYAASDWSGEPDQAGDYGHLSRWREWSAIASNGGEGT